MGKHTLFEESLRSPLIIAHPAMAAPGRPTGAMVETIDVFPTLCDLAGLPAPDFAHGVSLRPMLEDPSSTGHPAVSYHRQASSIRTETHRLVLHDDGYAELYDHTAVEGETMNIAQSSASVVTQLSTMLRDRQELAERPWRTVPRGE